MSKLNFKIKDFNQLSTQELYSILQLRSEVFVVEQDCVYQDLDGKDQLAYHVLGYKDSILIAYARVFKPGDYFSKSSIGRIIVKKTYRRFKYGDHLVKNSIEFIEKKFKEKEILISAQAYLINFYNKLGFEQKGEQYLEDDIPHIKMLKN
jgi:ElaA protein